MDATVKLALGLHSELNCQVVRRRNGTTASHRVWSDEARGGLVAQKHVMWSAPFLVCDR